MIPFNEVAVLDRNAEFRGVPTSKLMENAGKGLAEEIEKRYPTKNILFVCGTGNNAGDGFVAARYISRWRGDDSVTVYLVKGLGSVSSDLSLKNLKKLDCKIVEEWDLREDDIVIVDGLLGTGVKGRIREPYRSVIKQINEDQNPIVSIDVPSGLGADTAVIPDVTVTFHAVKEGMTKEYCGEIVVKDIGIPKEAFERTGPGELSLYPLPKEDSHKGENGRLMVVGGGPYTGAPALAGKAAYRTGADLVHIAAPSEIFEVVAGYSPSFIVHPLPGSILSPEHTESILSIAQDCDAVVLGPGLGDSQKTLEAVKLLLEKIKIPSVIDADALKTVGSGMDLSNAVLTPHQGEFLQMVGTPFRPDRADEFAKETGATLLVKAPEDYITDGEKHKYNDFGGPWMSVGGTGDVLAGVVGTLLSKGMKPFDASRLGAYLTCRAGERAYEQRGWGVLPDDICEEITFLLPR